MQEPELCQPADPAEDARVPRAGGLHDPLREQLPGGGEVGGQGEPPSWCWGGLRCCSPGPVVQRHVLMWCWENQPGSVRAHWPQPLPRSPRASWARPAGGPGMTPSCPLSPPERGERRLRPAQPLLPPVRRDAPVLAPAPRGPPEERRRHGDGGAGGLLQPPEQESPGGQRGHVVAVSPGWGWRWEALAAEVMPGRRWTPASAGGWDTGELSGG